MKILLTAPPQTGKSTVIDNVVRKFDGACRGIVAREMLDEDGMRTGFTSVNGSGSSRQFMFRTNTPTAESIGGEYDVDLTAVDDFVVPELRRGLAEPDALIYVDEIGRAQAKSQLFLSTLRELFACEGNLLAAIVFDHEPWSLEFKRHPAVCLLEVDADNRGELPQILLAAFSGSKQFEGLTARQKAKVFALLHQFLSNKQYVSAHKLFANAVGYVAERRVQRVNENPHSYIVSGKTRAHEIENIAGTGEFHCDCDLANGKGIYLGNRQLCSHAMSVILMHCED
jgi:nucleoside-triphosphatase THEP1